MPRPLFFKEEPLRIPLPNRLLDWLRKVGEPAIDWLNVPVLRGKIEVRRIDVLIVLFGIICCLYYSYAYDSWLKGILIGGSEYILMVMIGLWFLPAALPLRWQKVMAGDPVRELVPMTTSN
jgi:hypothetical protein